SYLFYLSCNRGSGGTGGPTEKECFILSFDNLVCSPGGRGSFLSFDVKSEVSSSRGNYPTPL
ncbi:MAG: hypothetical protein QXV17_05765, partial [Candidatus Micrarchaeaceae archaeon]